MQGLPLDPAPFTQWGVLGLLGLVLIVLVAIIYKIFLGVNRTQETSTKLMMDFVNVHRGETTKAMEGVAQSVATSNEKMTTAFLRQARALNEVLLTNRVLDQVEKMKVRGTQLTAEEIERVVRSVIHERTSAASEG